VPVYKHLTVAVFITLLLSLGISMVKLNLLSVDWQEGSISNNPVADFSQFQQLLISQTRIYTNVVLLQNYRIHQAELNLTKIDSFQPLQSFEKEVAAVFESI
jgi:hypothetical protein